MDNIGDWIYYIVILVVAGISWLNNSAKKRRQEADEAAPEASQEEMHTPPPPPPPPPVPSPRTKPRVSRQATHPSATSSIASSEGERMIKTDWSAEEDAAKDALRVEELELTDVEAWRKAVIYAEILKKYRV
ncbi:MAG: hypothetical protein LBC40_06920 [Dysgonamonadaceae bacterium]|jgi:cytoskeletal protein RodZ|nr:hypothetical protein [Dysgonamonadaceae bacterium]